MKTMKTQMFGIEVEMTGITRKAAAECIKEQIGSIWLEHFGGTYDAYHVMDEEGRKWKLVSDASIEAQKRFGTGLTYASSEYKVELVSPILTYKDIETYRRL